MRKKMKTVKKAASSKSAPSRSPAAKSPAVRHENSGDIIQLITQDHKPLKNLIAVMIDDQADFSEKENAFNEFVPLLMAHSKPEEQSLYVRIKNEDKLKIMGLEGDIEHSLITHMIDETQRAFGDEDLWMARCKVLAEFVEHHLNEEEDELFKAVRKAFDLDTRIVIGNEYQELRREFMMDDSIINPSVKPGKTSEVRAH